MLSMDSANSGSLQSSSADEEYDSRAAFLNPSVAGNLTSLPNLPPPQPPPPPTSSLFDSMSSYLDAFPRSPRSNPTSLLNLDIPWTGAHRPNCTDFTGLIGCSSSSSNPPISNRVPYLGNLNATHPAITPPDPVNSTAPRGSKKRSRASRRAPTTVLTTDTSNFRAMVQEFTGIPAPPFASSSFPRPRFDLFHAAAPSTVRSSGFQYDSTVVPPYLLRPFAQKVQATSFSPNIPSHSTTTSSANANANTSMTPPTTNTNTTSTNNYQLPSPDLGLSNQHQSLLNMQNPLFTFQSLLQSPKYNSPTMPFLGARSMTPSTNEYGMIDPGHANGHLGMIPSLIASEGMPSRGHGNDLSGWSINGPGSEGGDQGQSRPLIANYGNSQRVSSCKLNYSASTSTDFHAEKGSENVAARGEGMVDSWICSSD